MSYDIDLNHPVTKEVLHLDHKHHMRGGTYALGGTTECSLNITYNYSPFFGKVFTSRPKRPTDREWMNDPVVGIRTIYGMSGAESIPVLEKAISELGDDVDPDYWKSTEGNAKTALKQLLALAQMRPDGVWDGD